jgi:hypothetical protein
MLRRILRPLARSKTLATAGSRPSVGSVCRGWLFADKLDDDLVDKLADGAAQLVFDERGERLLGPRGHSGSLRRWQRALSSRPLNIQLRFGDPSCCPPVRSRPSRTAR